MSIPAIDADMPPADLLDAAELAARKAYAPYSRCHVGAVLRDRGGRLHAGCNVENAVFGLGNCAERHAVAAAVLASGPQRPAIVEIVVAAFDRDGDARPAAPCGACRQVLLEHAADARIWFRDRALQWRGSSVRALLPDAFAL